MQVGPCLPSRRSGALPATKVAVPIGVYPVILLLPQFADTGMLIM